MLARIQTVYLFLAAVCAALNIGVVPFWKYEFSNPDAAPMMLYGFGSFGKGLSMGILFWIFNAGIAVATLLPLINIALFNNRRLQAKLAALALQAKLGSDSVRHVPQLGFVLLVISPIFAILAWRVFLKDE
jgi:hypothetical protein